MTTADATTVAIRPRHRHRLTVGQRAPELTAMSLAGATVLVKGSRSMRMERVAEALAPGGNGHAA